MFLSTGVNINYFITKVLIAVNIIMSRLDSDVDTLANLLLLTSRLDDASPHTLILETQIMDDDAAPVSSVLAVTFVFTRERFIHSDFLTIWSSTVLYIAFRLFCF